VRFRIKMWIVALRMDGVTVRATTVDYAKSDRFKCRDDDRVSGKEGQMEMEGPGKTGRRQDGGMGGMARSVKKLMTAMTEGRVAVPRDYQTTV
jgi:hypothetical protein